MPCNLITTCKPIGQPRRTRLTASDWVYIFQTSIYFLLHRQCTAREALIQFHWFFPVSQIYLSEPYKQLKMPILSKKMDICVLKSFYLLIRTLWLQLHVHVNSPQAKRVEFLFSQFSPLGLDSHTSVDDFGILLHALDIQAHIWKKKLHVCLPN